MAKYIVKLNLILLMISTLSMASSSHPLNMIASCLIENHVTNFTLHPTSQNKTSNYYNILFSSLQNLRFAGDDAPKPSLIILPKSKEELVSSVICSRKRHYEVIVRSGGHSYEGMSAVSYDKKPYVIIDLMNLDEVTVDLASETAWVESGATLGQLYYTIAVQGKGVYGFSAGSCPTVGVGGHFSGGGHGLVSRKYGLAVDHVVDAILVDSDGRVLDRAAMGEDVFWAIRGGGGGSFGIVYAWKINLSKVPSKVTAVKASRKLKIHNMAQLVHKWQYVGPYLNDSFFLSVVLSSSGTENNTFMSSTFNGLHLVEKFEALSIINNTFPELGITEEECNEMSWIESVMYFAGLTKMSDLNIRFQQSKESFKAKSDYVTKPIPIEGLQGAMNILAKQPKGYIIMNPFGGEMARIAEDFNAFPHRKGNLYDIQYMITWNKAAEVNSSTYISWIRGFYEYMAPFVSSNPRGAYVNHMDLDIGGMYDDEDEDNAVEKGRVWGEKYFLNNYDRLVKAKTIIDPCNFFHHPQGIPPQPSARKCNKRCSSY